ncbi:MAG: hypothetical protein AAF541_19455 [Pseudomonadota bacterium]
MEPGLKIGLLITTLVLVIGCGSSSEPHQESTTSTSEQVQTDALPPGFLDEPPPPPTSNTTILSGGTLVVDQTISDSVIVITSGNVVAWGARGEVDMPNDSVGFDMRGKWIVPGRQNQDDSITPTAFAPNLPAEFVILSSWSDTSLDASHVVGTFADGRLVLQDESSD